jgi:hypothetical protein
MLVSRGMHRSLFCAVLTAFWLSGCASSPASSEAQPTSTAAPARPVCDEIAKICHSHDEHGGLPRDCHLMGHNPRTTNEQCEAKKAECLAACKDSHAH